MRSNPSKPLRGQMRRFRLMCSLLGAMALTACASVPIPDSLRSCTPATMGEVVTVGDLAAFSVRQEEAYQNCDLKRAALVKILEARR